jgi:hypothetical protein
MPKKKVSLGVTSVRQQYFDRIESLRVSCVRLELCQWLLLQSAKGTLSLPVFQKLCADHGWLGPEVRKRLAIAAKANLFIEHAEILPPTLNTQYKLTFLRDDVFERLVAAGDIKPSLTRNQAQRLVDKYAGG